MRFNGLLNQRLDSLLLFVHDFRGGTNFGSPFEPPLISQSNCRYDPVNLSRCPCSQGLQPLVDLYHFAEILDLRSCQRHIFLCVCFFSFDWFSGICFVFFFVGLDLRYNFGFADFNVAHMSSF